MNAGSRVAAIDLDPVYRAGLAWIVGGAPDLQWAGDTATISGAAHLVYRARADLLLIDSRVDPEGRLIAMVGGGRQAPAVLVVAAGKQDSDAFVGNGARGVVSRSIASWQLLECVRAALTGRVVPRPPRAGGAGPLSGREVQILILMAEGLGSAAVANLLRLSVETVRNHMRSILRKLDARDRAHAVAIGFRTGLLTERARERPTRQDQGAVTVE